MDSGEGVNLEVSILSDINCLYVSINWVFYFVLFQKMTSIEFDTLTFKAYYIILRQLVSWKIIKS